jgi:hypothetical protein
MKINTPYIKGMIQQWIDEEGITIPADRWKRYSKEKTDEGVERTFRPNTSESVCLTVTSDATDSAIIEHHFDALVSSAYEKPVYYTKTGNPYRKPPVKPLPVPALASIQFVKGGKSAHVEYGAQGKCLNCQNKMRELGDNLTNADCENVAQQMGKTGFATLYHCDPCRKDFLVWGAYGQLAMNVDEVVYTPSAPKKARITKIECNQCHHSARIRFPTQDGVITINAKLIVDHSDDPDIEEGATFQQIKHRLSLADALGECPHCEDEAFVTIHFDDGTKTSSIEVALQKI